MKALILAAGRGSRLGSETQDKPKCLTQLQQKPLLSWQLEALNGAGVAQVTAVTGYKKEKILPFIPEVFTNQRWQESNMVTSLLCCRTLLENNDTIVSYSDIIYSQDAVKKLMAASGDIVIAYDPNWLAQWQLRFDDPLDDAETFTLSPDSCLSSIGDHTDDITNIQGQYTGLFKITPTGFSHITSLISTYSQVQIDTLDMTALFSKLLEQHVSINTVAIDDFWFEVDNQKDLHICEGLFSKGYRLRDKINPQ